MKFIVGLFWIVIAFVVNALLVTVPVWLLWNWLAPEIFDLPEISLVQAFGVLILTGILFHWKASVKFDEQTDGY